MKTLSLATIYHTNNDTCYISDINCFIAVFMQAKYIDKYSFDNNYLAVVCPKTMYENFISLARIYHSINDTQNRK